MSERMADDLPDELIGHAVTWTTPEGERLDGMCRASRPSGSVMETANGRFHGIQYEVELIGTGKRVWTCTFPDHSQPEGAARTQNDPRPSGRVDTAIAHNEPPATTWPKSTQ